MERYQLVEKRDSLLRRILRTTVLVLSASFIAYVLLAVDVETPSRLFETVAPSAAEAGERPDGQLGRLRLLTRSLGYIRSNYVVPTRAQPLPMLLGALKGAEGLIPELMATPDALDAEQASNVVIRIADQQKSFPIGDISDLYEMNWRLLDQFQFIAAHLPPDVKPEEVEYAAINGMLQPLDEHSVFLQPTAYRELRMDTQGRFGGLGIVITTRKGLITIVSVMPDTPASKAGLKSGDQIVEIGDESTMNLSLNDAVTKLRGKPDTTITIVLQRKGWPEPRTFTLTRAEIHIQSVSAEVLGNGIGYVHIKHFQEDTRAEVTRLLGDLAQQGSLSGLVLDLRQDPGGLLDQAIEVSNLFVKRGTIVVTEGEGRRMRREHVADGKAPFANLPMVVIADQGSASAAEIVAGALKENDRALLLGDTTFGKGTVQVMYEVGDGALKLTVAQYLLAPGDLSIQGVGVTPDIRMVPLVLKGDAVSVGVETDPRDGREGRRLDAFGKVARDRPSWRVPYVLDVPSEPGEGADDDEEPPIKEDRFERDAQINLAARLLGGIKTPTRAAGLQEAQAVLQAEVQQQDVNITEQLRAQGTDWSAGAPTSFEGLKLAFSVDKPQPIVAGTRVKLRMTMRNERPDPVFRVHCETESENPSLDGRAFVFGRIAPGESVTREIFVTLPRQSWDRLDQVVFRLFQGEVEGPRPTPALLATRSLPRPRFAYTWQLQDPQGNGDGMVSPGETANLIFDVRNVGEGPADKVLVTLRNRSGEGVFLREGRITMRDGIPVGRFGEARFKLELRRGFEPQELTFEVSVVDLRLREILSEEFTVPVHKGRAETLDPRSQALRTRTPDANMLAAADRDAPLLFRIAEGTFLRGIGRIGDFYKVDLEGGRFGFVAVADVDASVGVVRFSPLPESAGLLNVAPAIDVTVPGLTPATAVAGPSIQVQGHARFSAHAKGDRKKITIFRGRDKVHFWSASGLNTEALIPIDATIPLVDGVNDISVHATEGKSRSTVRRFTLFKSAPASGSPEAAERP